MKEKVLNTIYFGVNLLSAIAGLILLFQEPSEVDFFRILGYSWRKVLLATLVVLIISLIFVYIRFWNRRKPPVQNDTISKLLDFDNKNKLIILILLTGFALLLVAELLFIKNNPDQYLSILANKIIGFLYFMTCFVTTTILRILISIVYNGIRRIKLNCKPKTLSLNFQPKVLVEFVFFELLYGYISYLLFKKFTPPGINFKNNLPLILILISVFCFGILLFTLLKNSAFLNRIRKIWNTDNKYYILFFLIVIIILSFGHIAFRANDDTAMMAIASGTIDGRPDEHLVYTNVIIGLLLKNLYTLIPEINWYVGYLLATLTICGVTLLNLILYYFQKNKEIALSIFALFFLSFFYFFNFTTIAILASFAGFSFLIKTLDQKKYHPLRFIASFLLVLSGGLIRLQGMLLVGLLMSPLFFYRIIIQKQYRLMIFLCAFSLIMIATIVIDNHQYTSNPEWNTFRIYNNERGSIHGTPKLNDPDTNIAFWNQIGWKKAGYSLFTSWIFIDNQVFTVGSLKEINKTFKYSINTRQDMLSYLTSLLDSSMAEILLTLLILLYSLSISFGMPKQRKILLWLTIGEFIMIPVLVAVLSRMPVYIFQPVLFMLDVFALLLVSQAKDTEERTFLYPNHLVIILSILLLFQLFLIGRVDQENENNQRSYENLVNSTAELLEPGDHPLVIIQASVLPETWVSPFSAANLPFRYIPTGWMINSPPYLHVLAEYHISNPILAIYQRKDVYLLGAGEEKIINYLEEVRNTKVKVMEIHEIPVPNYYYPYIHLVKLGIDEQ